MYNFFSRQHRQFMYLINQAVNIFFTNYFLRIIPADVIAVLYASDVLPSNTHYHIIYFISGISLRFLYRLLYGLDGLRNIVYNTSVHTQTFGFANTQNFQFTIFIFPAYHGNNLCCPDI